MTLFASLGLALASPDALVFEHAPSCEARAVEITMVGDVMQHGMQLRASTQPDGSYSWDGVFESIRPLVEGSDLAIANLETPIDASKSYAGFPFFNAPPALLDALEETGFDILQTANNHCLDRGRSGALATLEAVRGHGFETAGTHATSEERDTPWVLTELPGPVTVAFLAYTYGTNGLPMPDGEPWMVNWIDRGLVQDDIGRAREVADVVIAGIHWGSEYQHKPRPDQVAFAHSMVEAGADIVMGSHPHVVQPVERVTVSRPEGDRDALILYSLGNFVSNQRTFPRDGGLLARVTVATCVESGENHVVDARFTPVWVDDRLEDNTLSFRLLPAVPEEEACGGYDLTKSDCRRMAAFRDHTATLIPSENFSWNAGSTPWTSRRPAGVPWLGVPSGSSVYLTLPGLPPESPVAPVTSTWPPPPMLRSQAD